MEYFKRYKNYKNKPGYHDRVIYDKNTFLKDLDGSTEKFKDDYYNFCESYPGLVDRFNEAFMLISADPLPPQIVENETMRAYWECLHHYTMQLNAFINSEIKILSELPKSWVISFAITRGKLTNPFVRVDPLRDTGLRIVYEVVDGRVIFTNLNYHYYRNSAYSSEESYEW